MVVGPAIALLILGHYDNNYRLVFCASLAPGLLATLVTIFFIREKRAARP